MSPKMNNLDIICIALPLQLSYLSAIDLLYYIGIASVHQ